MKIKFVQKIQRADWVLFFVTFLLLIIGLVTLYSINLRDAVPDFGRFRSQAFFAILGTACMFLFALIDYRYIKDFAVLVYGATLFLLFFVLVAGATVRGTTGWFLFAGIGFQPVEFAKVAMALVFSAICAQFVGRIQPIFLFLILLAALLPPLFFILKQPDLGSAIVLVGMWFFLTFFLGMSKKTLLAIFLLGVLASMLFALFFSHDYQRERIATFFHPGNDPLGAGYHVTQSVIAVGSGGLFGNGFGLGPQSRLKFLPETETDFIFASIAEQLGFVGASLVVFVVATFLLRMLRVSRVSEESFGAFFGVAVASFFFIQIFINIGMNLGIAPVTGIPLPLVSYGGSSLVSSMIALGILQSIMIHRRQTSEPQRI